MFRGVAELQGHKFATATGRSLVVVDDVDEIFLIDHVAVVVTLWGRVSSKLLSILSESDREEIPGLLAATHESDLAAVILRLVGDQSRSTRFPQRVDIQPSIPVASHRINGRLLCGAKSSSDEIRAALEADAEILVIASHSDGIDVDLSPSVLCPLVENEDFPLGLTCVRRDWCHRRSLPLKAALREGSLIAPRSVRASLLLMLTCHTVVPCEGAENYSASALDRILVEGRVSCIVAMIGVGFLAPGEIDQIARIFEAGGTAGNLMRQLFQMEVVRQGRARFALLGDPEFTVRASARRSPPARRPAEISTAPVERSFLESLIEGCRRNKRPGTHAATEELAQALEAHPSGLAQPEVRKAAINAVIAFGTMPVKQWLSAHVTLTASGSAKYPCPRCNSFCIALHSKGLRKFERRTVLSCPACGVVEDYSDTLGPLGMDVSPDLRVSFRLAQLTSWETCLVVEYSKDRACINVELEVADGHASAWLPKELSTGNVIVAAVFVSAEGLSVARRVVLVPKASFASQVSDWPS